MASLIQHSAVALRHYREQVCLPVDELARKAGIVAHKIINAEDNNTPTLTFKQLEKIAGLLYVPMVYLTIDTLFTKNIPEIVDYRKAKDISTNDYAYQKIIHDACSDRENFLYVLDSVEESPKPFTLELTGNNAIVDAQRIRDYFKIDDQAFTAEGKDYYVSWRRAIEAQDVLVLEKDKVQFGSEGLSAYYAIMPIVIIFSSGQAETRRLFTMIHELVHLGLKQSVFDGVMTQSTYQQERYCDAVAGHVIAPVNIVETLWDNNLDVTANILAIRKNIKASKAAIAIQLLLLGKIDQTILDNYLTTLNKSASEGFRGLKKEYSVLNHFGLSFVQNVISAMWQNSISISSAAQILGVQNNPQALKVLQEKAFA